MQMHTLLTKLGRTLLSITIGSVLLAIVAPTLTSAVSVHTSDTTFNATNLEAELDSLPSPTGGIHIIFSTECTPYQDWQAQVLIESHRRTKQPGRITRIISCPHQPTPPPVSYAAYSTFHATHHTTPSSHADYSPYNKPVGIKEWVEKSGVTEKTIIMLDPDMIIVRPFLHAVKRGKPQAQYWDLNVLNGWHAWKEQLCAGRKKVKACTRDTVGQLNPYYNIGPPYLIHLSDLKNIVKLWTPLTEIIRPISKPLGTSVHWVSEMFAYSYSALFQNPSLPHLLDTYLSVSHVEGPNGQFEKEHSVIHYCMLYQVDGYKFDKRDYMTPEAASLLDCPGRLLPVPPSYEQLKKGDSSPRKSNAWYIHHVVPFINSALQAHHEQFCDQHTTSTAHKQEL